MIGEFGKVKLAAGTPVHGIGDVPQSLDRQGIKSDDRL
jgi:hypothetical protein